MTSNNRSNSSMEKAMTRGKNTYVVATLMAVALLITATPSFAQGACRHNELTSQPTPVSAYLEQMTTDRDASCASFDLSAYQGLEQPVAAALATKGCDWSQVPGLVKVTKKEDICTAAAPANPAAAAVVPVTDNATVADPAAKKEVNPLVVKGNKTLKDMAAEIANCEKDITNIAEAKAAAKEEFELYDLGDNADALESLNNAVDAVAPVPTRCIEKHKAYIELLKELIEEIENGGSGDSDVGPAGQTLVSRKADWSWVPTLTLSAEFSFYSGPSTHTVYGRSFTAAGASSEQIFKLGTDTTFFRVSWFSLYGGASFLIGARESSYTPVDVSVSTTRGAGGMLIGGEGRLGLRGDWDWFGAALYGYANGKQYFLKSDLQADQGNSGGIGGSLGAGLELSFWAFRLGGKLGYNWAPDNVGLQDAFGKDEKSNGHQFGGGFYGSVVF